MLTITGNGDDYYLEKTLEFKKNIDWTGTNTLRPTVDKLVQVSETTVSPNNILFEDESVEENDNIVDEILAFNPTVNASGSGTLVCAASNWGPVSLKYNVHYHAEKYIDSSYTELGNQDILITSAAVGDLPREYRDRVYGGPTNSSVAYTSSGSQVASFWSWNKSYWGSYIINYLVWGRGSYGGLLGSSSNNYYVKATGGMLVEDSTLISGGSITIKSNTF
ncbi:MAG: hypothetical protein ACOX2Q_11400 [Dehalobacterium sp.]|jgi:hypothetical protein